MAVHSVGRAHTLTSFKPPGPTMDPAIKYPLMTGCFSDSSTIPTACTGRRPHSGLLLVKSKEPAVPATYMTIQEGGKQRLWRRTVEDMMRTVRSRMSCGSSVRPSLPSLPARETSSLSLSDRTPSSWRRHLAKQREV